MSEDWLQDHPAVCDERHEKTQHAAQDNGSGLAVLGVHSDEHELSIAKTVAATTVGAGLQWKAPQ